MTKIKDLGETYATAKCTTVDMDIRASYGIEHTLFDNYKRFYVVTEVTVLDDGDRRFYSRLFGVSLVLVNPNTEGAFEYCIFFEKASESLLPRVEKGIADVYPASSILVNITNDEDARASSYVPTEDFIKAFHDDLRNYYKTLQRAPILGKLENIYSYLKANFEGDEVPEVLNADTIILESKRRIQTVMPTASVWAATKYLIPYAKSVKRVYVKVEGFLNLEEDIVFCRFFVNPDARNKNRRLYPCSLPDFNSFAIFQRLNGNGISLDLPQLDEKYSLMFDIVRVQIDEAKKGKDAISFQEAGLSIYPLCTNDGFVNFGRVLLPVFSPTLDWKSVDDFRKRNTWDLLEIMISDKERIEMTNRYVFLSVRDEYRKVGQTHAGLLRRLRRLQ